jgi:arylsulfatase A-like enzyme
LDLRFAASSHFNSLTVDVLLLIAVYDSGSRVALMLSGPGIAPGQLLGVDKIASLNDVFPTVMDMAGLPIPSGLAGV